MSNPDIIYHHLLDLLLRLLVTTGTAMMMMKFIIGLKGIHTSHLMFLNTYMKNGLRQQKVKSKVKKAKARIELLLLGRLARQTHMLPYQQ
jgi:hypothetical protein